ncbi:MAG: hypothetical protein ACRDLT_07625 [Solirubrobacteraceae bacterium]
MDGQSTNAAVVLDFSRHLNRILEVDPHGRSVRAARLRPRRPARRRNRSRLDPDEAQPAGVPSGEQMSRATAISWPKAPQPGDGLPDPRAGEVVHQRGALAPG